MKQRELQRANNTFQNAWEQIALNGLSIEEMETSHACNSTMVRFDGEINSFKFDIPYGSCKMETSEQISEISDDKKFIQFMTKFSLKTAEFDFGSVQKW